MGMWDGEETAPTWNTELMELTSRVRIRLSSRTVAPQFHIFGMYNTGTNMLQSLLDASMPTASVCPDTVVHYQASHRATCKGAHHSKHANPESIREFLSKNNQTYAIFVVRDPFSFLES